MGHLTTSGDEPEIGTVFKETAPGGKGQLYLNADFLPVEFRHLSELVAHDTVQYVCHHEQAAPAPNKTALIMRSLVDDTLKNRLDFMRELVLRLGFSRKDHVELLDSLATQMFDDEVVTWGRIVTLYAFCGYLARYCLEKDLFDCPDAIAEALSGIVTNRLGLWIVANGGWTSFESQFPALCLFDTSFLWKIIAIVGLLAGAIVAFYSSIQYLNPSP